MGQQNDLIIHYSVGTGLNFGRAKNRTDSWPAFKKRFRDPLRTTEKFSHYLKLSDKEQIELKSHNGWFYRTQVSGKRRNRRSGLPTDIITLDFDYATPDFVEEIQLGLALPGTELFCHSSRRHTPEKPRLRIIIPVQESLPNEYYSAVSRIIAKQIDPDMSMVDQVSFRVAQMMFMPTVSADAEYLFEEQRGDPLDWRGLLDDFEATVGDWRDIQNLPTCPGEKLRETADKAEDPTTKTGMVGDFCRAYTIQEAIAKFIPDVYDEVDGVEDRYTYLGGTTTNGMEIYDDGLFMYSHHGSDPAGDQLLNAFDMVRIHLFGKEDEDVDEDTPQSQRPSWAAMTDLLREDKKYLSAVAESHYDMQAMFDDLEVEDDASEVESYEQHTVGGDVEDPEIEELIGTPKIALPTRAKGAPVDPDWFSKLDINPKTGEILPTLPNITAILQNDKRFRGVFEYNEFIERPVTRRKLNTKLSIIAQNEVEDKSSGDPLEDLHYLKVRAVLEYPNGKDRPGYGMKVTDRDLYGALATTTDHWRFNPIGDLFGSIEWDGIERLETFFIDYLGCPDNAYYREIALKWFAAGVARTFEPGHKFDFAVILEGVQGKRKSTMIEIIGMDWSGELKADFHDEKRLVEQMQGCFVMELPELSNFNRSSVEDMKAFIAATKNNVRLSYERSPKMFYRRCIFMGSTNKDQYLLDDTGNRRFWPIHVEVEQIDTDKMRREILQVWAEAVDVYRRWRADQPTGYLPLHLTNPDAQAYATEQQESRRQLTEADSYEDTIARWLDEPYAPDPMEPEDTITHNEITAAAIWQECLGMAGFPDRSKSMEIGKAMKRIGWIRIKARVPGTDHRVWVYRRPGISSSQTYENRKDDAEPLL